MHDKPLQIDLLRHGRCEGGDIFRGSTDVLLSEQGHAQMQAGVAAFDQQWDLILCSPLKRCAQFGKALAEQSHTPFEQVTALREMDFGDWEGQLIERIWREDEERMLAWSKNPALSPPPNGEPLEDVFARISLFMADLVERYPGKNILLISHGGVMRVILAYCLGMPAEQANRFEVPYACSSRLAYFAPFKRWRLVSHNTPAGH